MAPRLLAPFVALLAASPAGAQPAPRFADVIRANHAKWDADGDGVLSPKELDRATLDPKIVGPAAAALATMRVAPALVREQWPEGETVDVVVLARDPRTGPTLNAVYARALDRIRAAKGEMLFTKDRPDITTIRQGENGDCFCLAPLGALVYRDPAEIVRRIQPNGDGRLLVDLPRFEVIVPRPTDTEIGVLASEGSGLWVNAYLRAIGAAMKQSGRIKRGGGLGLDYATNGGNTGYVMELLTGHAVDFARTPPGAGASEVESLGTRLRETLAARRLAACGTSPAVATPGIQPRHAYAIVRYDRDLNEVVLWDPHRRDFAPRGRPGPANGYPTKRGQFSVPLAEFARLFPAVFLELDRPAAD